ncbi:MAG: hypothetical protein COV29_04460 [Candidatus Yanofskybacteria bacterium CG10_big_fil_rev_8_21_14_0_10_36_16]|uniref:Uncharacterized protein n=1 Tax=Candidatus Yanofskybacteria bacterium CG10_big_fil_rev_8_21_14_0_10_36_16 TaxID=1975096 RepID=A0A2J0Q6G2_9BACT|nr:MAG: hypothetical protein COV29_04460 [Candidatus Yanofskybacteria bacterium CG10_big_fil_rev_8_21_14_0_10_36_16]
MKKINFDLSKTKEIIKKQEDKDKKLRQEFKKIINELFPDIKKPLQYVKDFYSKNEKLYILTTNKSFSNELLLVKETIIDQIKGVKDLVIK